MDAVIKDQKQMINYLHKQAEDHVKTRNMLIEMNEELEKEIHGKNEEIMKLKKELKQTNLKESNDVYKLLEEIAIIKNENQEKEDTLALVVNEKKSLQEDLHHLQEEMELLKGEIAKVKVEENKQNLFDELGISDPLALNVSPAFEPPNLKSHKENTHGKLLEKKVWKLKLIQLERSISSEKLKITSDLLKLKESEYCESKMLGCRCKSYCRILHSKHNWKKSTSQEIWTKLEKLNLAYSCEKCDETFPNVDCLNLHEKTSHTGKESGRNIQVKLQGGDC